MFKPHQGKRPGGFKGGGRPFGQNKPWERGGFGGRDGDRPTMHEATCAQCGNACEVPFRPIPGRDVFCSNCFKRDDDSPQRGPMRSMDSRRPSFEDRQMYKAVCEKCHKDCEVPFRPTGAKPIYCKPCLMGNRGPESRGFDQQARGADQVAEQFKAINTKLDAIIRILNPSAAPAPVKAFVVAEAVKETKKPAKETVATDLVIEEPKKAAKTKVAVKKSKKSKA